MDKAYPEFAFKIIEGNHKIKFNLFDEWVAMNAECSDNHMCNRVYNSYSIDYNSYTIDNMSVYVKTWTNIFLQLNNLNKELLS